MEIIISGQVNNISCGAVTGDIIGTVNGGTPPYSYVWYDELNNIMASTKDLLGQPAGTYRLVVTDANNCTQEYQGTILELPAPVIDLIDNTDCSIRIEVSGGQKPYQYSIDGGSIYQADSLFESLYDGNYSVYIKDASDCEIDGGTVNIDGCNLRIDLIDTTNCSIRIEASGGEEPYLYSIDGDENYQANNLFASVDDGNYNIWVKDANNEKVDGGFVSIAGCSPATEFTIYNAFSPNDDAWNNVWNIPGIEKYPNCVVKIFNSWGTVVFNSPLGYPVPWDGKLSNGNTVPAGTYYYVIDLGDGSKILSGTLSVIK